MADVTKKLVVIEGKTVYSMTNATADDIYICEIESLSNQVVGDEIVILLEKSKITNGSVWVKDSYSQIASALAATANIRLGGIQPSQSAAIVVGEVPCLVGWASFKLDTGAAGHPSDFDGSTKLIKLMWSGSQWFEVSRSIYGS